MTDLLNIEDFFQDDEIAQKPVTQPQIQPKPNKIFALIDKRSEEDKVVSIFLVEIEALRKMSELSQDFIVKEIQPGEEL